MAAYRGHHLRITRHEIVFELTEPGHQVSIYETAALPLSYTGQIGDLVVDRFGLGDWWWRVDPNARKGFLSGLLQYTSWGQCLGV